MSIRLLKYNFFIILILTANLCGLAEFPSFNSAHIMPKKHSSKLNFFKDIYEKNKVDNLTSLTNSIIPHKIHQIWIGPNPLPEKFLWMIDSWKKMHPKWEYKLWTNEDLADFNLANLKAFDKAPNWGAKADIFRYEIIERYGGVYIDIDFECIKPLDILHQFYSFYCVLIGNTTEVANGLIAAPAHHPVMQICINIIKQTRTFSTNFSKILEETGPGLITKAILQHLESISNHDRFMIFPSTFFLPFPNDLRYEFWNNQCSRNKIMQYVKDYSFAVHYWATSWQH